MEKEEVLGEKVIVEDDLIIKVDDTYVTRNSRGFLVSPAAWLKIMIVATDGWIRSVITLY